MEEEGQLFSFDLKEKRAQQQGETTSACLPATHTPKTTTAWVADGPLNYPLEHVVRTLAQVTSLCPLPSELWTHRERTARSLAQVS